METFVLKAVCLSCEYRATYRLDIAMSLLAICPVCHNALAVTLLEGTATERPAS